MVRVVLPAGVGHPDRVLDHLPGVEVAAVQVGRRVGRRDRRGVQAEGRRHHPREVRLPPVSRLMVALVARVGISPLAAIRSASNPRVFG
jgi:hypothetical protein